MKTALCLRCGPPHTKSYRFLSTGYLFRSQLFAPTQRESPADAAIPSHQLLVRGGYMRRCGLGTFQLLPLGLRVQEKISQLIDKEMSIIGGQKLSMPIMLPSSLWKQTGRWDIMGPELIRLQDRHGYDHCLGPTHEESFTSLVAQEVQSYKQLPLRLYQIGPKYRDERRPRFGMLRAREFFMKDMYSFDVSEKDALHTYEIVKDSYNRIFGSLGINYAQVEADTGTIGGNLSHEFHVLADIGEDGILQCSTCNYTANTEKAVSLLPRQVERENECKNQIDTISDLCGMPGVRLTVFCVDEIVPNDKSTESKSKDADFFVVLTPESHFPNPVKLSKLLDSHFSIAQVETSLLENRNIRVLLDEQLEQDLIDQMLSRSSLTMKNIISSATRGDFLQAASGDTCSVCKAGLLKEHRGIEVGQVFYLGTKYSSKMNAMVKNSDGTLSPMQMGCYGIGVSRLLAAMIEASHDEAGIVWPAEEVSPFRAIIILGQKEVFYKDQQSNKQTALSCCDILSKRPGWHGEVIIDDRSDVSTGVKLKEALLMGFPWIFVIAKQWEQNGMIEIISRKDLHKMLVSLHTVSEGVDSMLSQKGK